MSDPLHDLNADLHAHSTVSDGTLAPAALVRRAAARGVELFALTDHDEVGGLAEAQAAACEVGLALWPGVEISVSFGDQTVHIVGLGIDAANEELIAGLRRVRSGRRERAQAMADGLAAAGIAGAFDGALKYVGNPELISRTHFARYLVEAGVCSSTNEVFTRFLVPGKPGYVEHGWARLAEAVRWIVGAGGVAVLAHPARYRLTATEQWALFSEFKEAGGAAIEIAVGAHGADELRRYAQVAREFGFEGSRGSDFHSPVESNTDLGAAPALPYDIVPVWHRFH
ncbi:MAG: 3',5'-nucleoside bisphosphate phosphatase [Betaproteobacteria bacterium]